MKFHVFLFTVFSFVFSFGQTPEKTDELFLQAENTFAQGDTLKAAELFEEAALNEMNLETPRFENCIEFLYTGSLLFYQKNNFERALDNRKAGLILCEKVYGKDHEIYASGISWLVNIQYMLKNYAEVTALAEEAETILKKVYGENNEDYRYILNLIGMSYRFLGNQEIALDYFRKLVEISSGTIDNQSAEYANYLNNLALEYQEMQQFDLAFPLFQQTLDISKKNIDQLSDRYLLYFFNINNWFVHTEKFQDGLALNRKEMDFVLQKFGRENIYYAGIVKGNGIMYKGTENTTEAEKSFTESKNILEKIGLTESEDYGLTLCELSDIYRMQGKTEAALPVALRGVEILKKIFGENSIQYAVRLNNLGQIYMNLGQNDKALTCLSEALPIVENHYGDKHPEYNMVLSGLGLLYQNLGQYDKAQILFTEIKDNTEKTLGKYNDNYLIAVNNLAYLYAHIGYYHDAEILFEEALEIAKTIFSQKSITYARQLSNLGFVYQNTGQAQKAVPLQIEALSVTEKQLGKKHTDYGKYLNNLAISHMRLGEYRKAIPLQKEVLEILQNSGIKNHYELVNYLSNLGILYQGIGDLESALPYYLQSLELLNQHIQNTFSLLSENEKIKFIDTVSFHFSILQSYFGELQQTNNTVPGFSYNIELTTKALVLNASQYIRDTILGSDSKEAKYLFLTWLVKKGSLAKQYALPKEKQTGDLFAMEIQVESLEKQLIQTANSIKPAPIIGNTDWKNIQNKLQDHETAIEFTVFNQWNGKTWTGEMKYAALLLRKNNPPKYIPLFAQNQLDALLKSSGSDENKVNQIYRGSGAEALDYDTGKLYELLWKPLEKEIQSGQTVYFAPSGTLHQIAFSAIKTPEGKYLSDIYNLKQLTTTAKILQKNENSSLQNIALFGGINYNESELFADKTQKQEFVSRSLSEDLLRGGTSWNYLDGTLAEVQNIKKEAEESRFKTEYFTGKNALEENLKSLNGKNSPDILHIATHGFFFPDPQKQYKDQFLLPEENNVFKLSDNPLNRAGLLFAGANETWKGNPKTDGSEDGILTAYEVSNVALLNTKLVVLSACETGLGDIKGSEGVFGLQRAFKATGVEYIMMSLWQVPDKETAEFMEKFYQELFKTKNIERSFADTQNFMKQKYPDDPYKWAAFVLIR